MNLFQALALVLVAAVATTVVFIRVPRRQVVAMSFYGVCLTVLFLAFEAPDVALSELAVGAVIVPLMLLLTLAKVRDLELEEDRMEGNEEDSV